MVSRIYAKIKSSRIKGVLQYIISFVDSTKIGTHENKTTQSIYMYMSKVQNASSRSN